ncbi:MAG: methyltransferase domain-containing protein [Deltaproteobacteria bacterium]|nr:methyltransferase domain-containing protein [Deltaproteobacteria bacterium]
MSIERHAPDWLVALHEGAGRAPHDGVHTNLSGLLQGWREWPDGMDFLSPDSPNYAWKALMTRMYVRRIEEELGSLPGGKVLDLACGGGRFSALLSEQGAAVHGLDATLPSLEVAQNHLAGRDARLVWGDVGELERLGREVLSPPYDAAFAIELLCYLPDPAAVLRALRGLLVPGAPVVLSVEAWPGALLTDGGDLDASTASEVLRTHTLHEEGGRWVHAFEKRELEDLLRATGFEVLGVHGTHYVFDGPLAAFADPSKLDGGAYDEALLELESTLRSDPSLGALPRAWLAVAKAV